MTNKIYASKEVAAYVAEINSELIVLARDARHEFLVYLLEMTVAEANMLSLGAASRLAVG